MEENVEALLALLEENKAKDVALFDVRDEKSDEDFLILANMPSPLENKAFAELVTKSAGLKDYPEGYNRGEWIITKLDKILLHTFIPSKREKYNLDKLYQSHKVPLNAKKPKGRGAK